MVAVNRRRQPSSPSQLWKLTSLMLISAGMITIYTIIFSGASKNCDLYSQYLLGQQDASSSLLSARQSYGFFDNIPDVEWRRMQERARSMVQYMYPEKPELGYQDPIMWYSDNIQPDFTCPQSRRIGGHGDGPKWTCDPHRLSEKKDCLIYSVGSEGNYNFEESIIREVGDKHCEIHVFDPGNYARPGDPKLNNIHYHQWGLKSSYDTEYNAAISLNALNGAPPVLKTFQETIKALGHEGRTIDVFKIDCEKCEWANYRDWISHDIQQILIETHGVPTPVSSNGWHHKPMLVAEYFDAFTENNFAMFSKEVNVYGGGNCIEFSFIKLHPDFWGREFKSKFNKDKKARANRAAHLKAEPPRKISLPVTVASQMTFSGPRIPKQLIFTYKWNLLEKKVPPLLHNNTRKIVNTYLKAWGVKNAPVWFLDDRDCRSAIQAGYPDLVKYFDAETYGPYKADMCRIAALHMVGGYYFDVDLEVIEPYLAPKDVGFASVRSGNNATSLFNAFIAAEAGSPVLFTALDAMVNFYKAPASQRKGMKLGPATLYDAMIVVPEKAVGRYHLLEEIDLDSTSQYPDTPRRAGDGCCCNHAVHDPWGESPKVHFYSRILDASTFCTSPGTTIDPKEQLITEALALGNA